MDNLEVDPQATSISSDMLAALQAKRREIIARKAQLMQERAKLILPSVIKISKLEAGNGIVIELPDGCEVTFAMVESVRYAVASAINHHKHE